MRIGSISLLSFAFNVTHFLEYVENVETGYGKDCPKMVSNLFVLLMTDLW